MFELACKMFELAISWICTYMSSHIHNHVFQKAQVTVHRMEWKRYPLEKGQVWMSQAGNIFSCVPICLRLIGPLERCVMHWTKVYAPQLQFHFLYASRPIYVHSISKIGVIVLRGIVCLTFAHLVSDIHSRFWMKGKDSTSHRNW